MFLIPSLSSGISMRKDIDSNSANETVWEGGECGVSDTGIP